MSADLQREHDDREADQHRDADGHHHDISVVEAGNHAHHVRHRQRQDTLRRKKTLVTMHERRK